MATAPTTLKKSKTVATFTSADSSLHVFLREGSPLATLVIAIYWKIGSFQFGTGAGQGSYTLYPAREKGRHGFDLRDLHCKQSKALVACLAIISKHEDWMQKPFVEFMIVPDKEWATQFEIAKAKKREFIVTNK